ncbi:MAG: SpoIIE family protein phosphatase [bacterium]|nr:SpoIIE family protein phosphatase [bacterium]
MAAAKKLLIVDDELEIRENLRDFAEFKGYEVVEAGHGEEALEKIAGAKPDLIVSDLMMPKMGGLELLQEIVERGIETPVVIMTAFGTMESAIEAMKRGASDFVAKPIDLPYLIKVVERVLNISEMQQRVKEQQRQLDEDLLHAGIIQRCLLPEKIETARLHLDYRYEPLIAIGGDYLSIHQHGDHGIAAALYDVSGHGVSAALTANLVHTQLQQRLAENRPPSNVVHLLNRFITANLERTSMFITLCLAVLDLDEGVLTVSNAGHPDLFIRRGATGALDAISSHMPPVGMIPKILSEQNETVASIESGDRIMMYTDGFLEARNAAGAMLGMEGLKAMIQRHAHLPLSDFIDRLYHDLKIHHQGEIDDDLTFLAIDVK